jgi:nicotinamidase-related amidase
MRVRSFGFRVVIVQDALCSSSDTGHDALMDHVSRNCGFTGRSILVNANETVRDLWRPAIGAPTAGGKPPLRLRR